MVVCLSERCSLFSIGESCYWVYEVNLTAHVNTVRYCHKITMNGRDRKLVN
jgi:hypothetical protein